MSSGSSFVNSMQVSNAITLNGTLRVERAPSTSFTFTTGNSWTIMEGAPVTGNFSSVQIDPLLRSNAGQAVSVSTSGNAVTLSVEQRLVLQVDRFTGADKYGLSGRLRYKRPCELDSAACGKKGRTTRRDFTHRFC
jgi:hypothetical protein